ncbi:hypothetical protein B0H11DRAFT_1922976 [Mycena galericulata]|nr:hypothetical protein B0H11DRAFT_1922976 [Mycena galericulata]
MPPRRSFKFASYDDDDEADADYAPAGGSHERAVVRTRKNPDRHQAKVVIPPDVRAAQSAGTLLDPYAVSEAYTDFLKKLQLVSDARHGLFDIHSRLVTWKDSTERKAFRKWAPNQFLSNENTVKGWLHERRGPQPIRLAVVSSFVDNPVKTKTSMTEWGMSNWHIWVLMEIRAPKGHNGRALAIYDCNAQDFPDWTRFTEFNNARSKTLVKVAQDGCPNVPLFVSKPTQVLNNRGICVQLTVERLMEFVQEGLTIQRDAWGKVVEINNFTRMSA